MKTNELLENNYCQCEERLNETGTSKFKEEFW